MIDLAFVIGNLNEDHGGAQKLLFDICHALSDQEFSTTVYYMFGEGTYRSEFEKQGTTVVDLAADSNYDIIAFKRLIDHLQRSEHDLLQTNSPISGVWGRFAGRLASIPEIVSVEHSVHDGYPMTNRLANGLSLPLSTGIVGVSDAVVNSFRPWEKYLIPSNTRIETILNGVDIEAIEREFSKTTEVLAEVPVNPNDPIIGSVGRFTEAKGYEYLIRAFSQVKQTHSKAQLLLIGGGELREELEAEAKATNCYEDVHFTGLLSNVFPYLSAFDVAVFPSLWEGFGLTPVEAMIGRSPIVATDIPAFNEVINDAGVLVSPEDEDAIARVISRLLNNPMKREELGQKGYEQAIANFSIERTVDEYTELYTDLVT